MTEVSHMVILFLLPIPITGINIAVGKPSVSSSVYFDQYEFLASYGNDGGAYVSSTAEEENPYWQVDLQGYYHVSRIRVTTGSGVWDFAEHLRLASIGIAVQDINCTDDQVFECGQWPDERLPDVTKTFDCTHSGPVRYIRVWRNGLGRVAVREVEAEGTPLATYGASYDKITQKEVSTPSVSLSVDSVTVCGTLCHKTQPCIAFSYSSTQQPNCLLASDVTMMSDVAWVSYMARTCIDIPKCH